MKKFMNSLTAIVTLAGGQQLLAETRFIPLGVLDDCGNSEAAAIFGDGLVVVGGSPSGPDGQAFRWTEAGGMSNLGTLAGSTDGRRSYGVSGDGRVVVGGSPSAGPGEAFVWTQETGMVEGEGQ